MESEQIKSNSLAVRIVLVVVGLLVAWVAFGIFQAQTDNVETLINVENKQKAATESVAYRNISPDELEVLLTADGEDENIVLIDTHIPEQEHIPSTDAFIPFNEIANRLNELPYDKAAPIVLYCRSGNMSAKASDELAGLGYTNVYNLEGGTNAWRASGRDVVAVSL